MRRLRPRAKTQMPGKKAAEMPAALARSKELAQPSVRRLLTLNTVRLAARLCVAACLSLAFGYMLTGHGIQSTILVALACALAAAGALHWAAEVASARSEARVGSTLLDDMVRAAGEKPAMDLTRMDHGALISGSARHPRALAHLVVRAKAARQMLALGPLLVAVAIAPVSWQASAALVCATPAMVFMFVVVGAMIGRRAEAQEAALGKLATQFADRMRGIQTILASDAVSREGSKLSTRLHEYGTGTMGVLSVAFLNSAVLDFFASLSIAVLAVLLGLGHLGLAQVPGFQGLELWQSLFILLLAPEYFAPFRRYAETYHAKAEGEAAARAMAWVYDENDQPVAPRGQMHGTDGLVLAHGLALDGVAFPETGLVAVTGASGSGKSTFLRAVAGVEPPARGHAGLMTKEDLSWVSSQSALTGEILAEAISADTGASPAALFRVAQDLGLHDGPYLPEGLATKLVDGASGLSGGQRMRAALARALLRGGPILADEPTAKLDSHTARVVRRVVRDVSRERLVLVATHDKDLVALADMRIALDARDAQPKRKTA